MRLGLQRKQLPDRKGTWRQQPTIWQYAQKGGFKTVLIDGFRPIGLYHSYMDAFEGRAIDLSVTQAGNPEYQRDGAIADTLIDLLKSDERMFIYVNKYGVHFPYKTKYPPDISYDSLPLVTALPLDVSRRTAVAEYHKGIRWSVDEFFAKVLPNVSPDTLIIYTSDHGQALFEAGYDFQHCSSSPGLAKGEVMVPLFVSSGSTAFAARLKEQAELGFNQATHFEIFPTLLVAMGYAEDWVAVMYGPSLLNVPLGRPREILVGQFFDPSAYWIDIDKK
jgi:glucan phosphoethanolaminetransferase (alkaline phosphatase superfamily)